MQFDQSETPTLLRELETAHGVKEACDDRRAIIRGFKRKSMQKEGCKAVKWLCRPFKALVL